MGRYISTTGTAAPVLREVDANFNASVNDRILADTSVNGAITITLPANTTLLVGDTIQIIDVGAAAATANITIGRNSSLVQGATEDLTIDVSGSIVTLLYTGSTYGWVITSS